jgi:glyoxylase-like metal-dependent hydrolase (beta-lactamase superfamily II)
MDSAAEIDQVAPGFFLWQVYDRRAKADLFSTAIATQSGAFLVDPTALADAALAPLLKAGPIRGLIVTNSNHLRASSEFANRFSVPIYAHRDTFTDEKPSDLVTVEDGGQICDVLDVIGINGAVPGEIVIQYPPDGGALVVGDALINFEPYGFAFLPRKYCSNEKEMRRSLRKLLNRRAERMFFAHGTPILSGASARLQQLLNVDPESLL